MSESADTGGMGTENSAKTTETTGEGGVTVKTEVVEEISNTGDSPQKPLKEVKCEIPSTPEKVVEEQVQPSTLEKDSEEQVPQTPPEGPSSSSTTDQKEIKPKTEDLPEANPEKDKSALGDDVLSISSEDLSEVDCAGEPLEVSSDEEMPTEEEFEIDEMEVDPVWTIEEFVPDPNKLTSVRRPWSAHIRMDSSDAKHFELFKGAVADLSEHGEYSVEDWDATLEALLANALHPLIDRYLRETETTPAEFFDNLVEWIRFGLIFPEQDAMVKTKDGKEESTGFRHLRIGLRLLFSVVMYPSDQLFEAIVNKGIIDELCLLMRDSEFTKIRSLSAELLLDFLNHPTKAVAAAKVVMERTVADSDETFLDIIIDQISHAEERGETSHQIELLKVCVNRALLSISFDELSQSVEASIKPDAIPNNDILSKFRDFGIRFWSVKKECQQYGMREYLLYRLIEKRNSFVEKLCVIIAKSEDSHGALMEVVKFVELLLSSDDFHSYGIVALAHSNPKALSLFLTILKGCEQQNETCEINESTVFYESSIVSESERICRLRESIVYGIRALELLEQLKNNLPNSASDTPKIEDEQLLNPLHELLLMASQRGCCEEWTARICATSTVQLFHVFELLKQERNLRKRHELIDTTYAQYCIQLLRHAFKCSSDSHLWHRYSDRIRHIQNATSLIPHSLLDWSDPVADALVRTVKDGSTTACQKIRTRLQDWTKLSHDVPTPETVMLSRLLEVALNGNYYGSTTNIKQFAMSVFVNESLISDVEKLFKRITSAQHGLWRLGTPIGSEESFNYRETAKCCLRIITMVYGEMVHLSGNLKGLSSSLFDSLLEVVSMCSGMNGQKDCVEGRELRKLAENALDVLLINGNSDDKEKFFRVLFDMHRPSLYPAILSLLWKMGGSERVDKGEGLEKQRHILEECKQWDGLATIVFQPSIYVSQMVVTVVKRLCSVSPRVTLKIAKCFLDYLDPLLVTRSLVKKDEVTEISDEEDAKDKKSDPCRLLESPLESSSLCLTSVIDRLHQLILSSPPLQVALASAVSSSRARSLTWSRVYALSLKEGGESVEQREYADIVKSISQLLFPLDLYTEKTDDIVEAQEKEEREKEEKRKKISEPVGEDCVDLEMFDDGDDSSPVSPHLSSPAGVLKGMIDVLCKWEDHPLTVCTQRLELLKRIAGISTVHSREVSRSLCVSLTDLLSRLDAEFSSETECLGAIDGVFELIQTISDKDSKVAAHVALQCDMQLSLICELLQNTGVESARAEERTQTVKQWAGMEADAYFVTQISFVPEDRVTVAVEGSTVDSTERLMVNWNVPSHNRLDEVDEKLLKTCEVIAKEGNPLRKILREAEEAVRISADRRHPMKRVMVDRSPVKQGRRGGRVPVKRRR